MSFSIVTDSASDIQPEFARKEKIFVVPTLILFDTEVYRENEIEKEVFINRLQNGEIAKTSQPNPSDFLEIYNLALQASDSQEVLGIHISSKLSGTFSGANLTANTINTGNIQIFDTLNITIGSGYFVYLAAFLRKNGYSLSQTLSILNETRYKIHLEIFIPRVEYLHRSGRINLGQFSLLRLLKLKPILNCVNGELIRAGLVLGYNAGIKKILQRIQNIDMGNQPFIMIGHVNTPHIMAMYKENLLSLKPSDIIEITVCTTLLSHTGLDPVGIGIAPGLETFLN